MPWDSERLCSYGFPLLSEFAGAIRIGVLVFIGMIVFWRAVYAWGFLGVPRARPCSCSSAGWPIAAKRGFAKADGVAFRRHQLAG
jgi:hypothetical protein